MDGIYADLGLTTVITRLGLKGPPSRDAACLQLRLRQLEAAMPAFNLDPSVVHLAAEIAAFERDLSVDRRLALIMLVVASLVALGEGSTRLPVTGPLAREPMARILEPLCLVAETDGVHLNAAEMARVIAKLLDEGAAPSVIGRSPDDYRPLLFLPPYLYHQRIRAAEVRLAERLRPLLDADGAVASAREIAAAIADVCDRPHWIGEQKMTLSSEQRDAVGIAAMHRLAIISGGPGTGKTSIVLAIVRLLVRLGIAPGDIALAAPTGKAAHRMGESIRDGLARVRNPAAADRQLIEARLEPLTMHRLLGYSPGRGVFLHHRNNPPACTVAIVDESSMLDLDLMQRLAAALRPAARLILLGDADQLPSVAAGAVFRDLVEAVSNRNGNFAGRISTRLTHSYRINQDAGAGRAIFILAQKINQGVIADGDGAPLIRERAAPEALGFAGVELIDTAHSSLDDFLDCWYDAKIRNSEIDVLANKVYTLGENGFDRQSSADLRRVYSHSAASRILCVTRVRSTGAERINTALHRRAVAAAIRPPDRAQLMAGEPVMVVRNDYDRNLFNGDQGIIARVSRPDGGESAMAVFIRGDSCTAFHLTALGDVLELSYATTIHKAQGSEFDCVAVIMPEADIPLLTRELLYTAVSRARHSVVLVGSIETARAAVARVGTRYSGLAELLTVAAADRPA